MKPQIKCSFLLPLLLALAGQAHGAAITWTNTSGGNWSVAANWSPNQVPTNTDDGLITNAGIYTVTLDVSGVVANLALVAGDGAGGVPMFIVTNANSDCPSIAGA